jgi:heptosyltransferase III
MSDLTAVFHIGSLGDSIVSIPALLSIREYFPSSTEYLLVTRYDSEPYVASSHVFDLAWKPAHNISYRGPLFGPRELPSVAGVLAKLRYYRPNRCVSLMYSRRSQRQIARDRAFFRLGGVKDLIGFRPFTADELATGLLPSATESEAYLRFRRIWKDSAEHKFAKYAAGPLVTPGNSAKAEVENWITRHRRHAGRPLVAICPYSNSTSKDIPDETTVDVMRRLEDEAGVETVILGGKKDFGRAEALVVRSGAGLNASGAFSVEESAALLKSCYLAICADSGPMHLAAAVGTPTVVAFSRVNKQLPRWFPVGTGHTILTRNPACAGCGLTECNVSGHPCMRDISADQILDAALNKLKGLPLLAREAEETKVLAW